MSFLDGKNQEEVRLGHVKPGKDEKCLVCGKPPATSGVEYCASCGHAYAVSIGAKERVVQVVEKKERVIKAPRTADKIRRKPRRYLTAEERKHIIEYVASGGKQVDMARRYDVSQPTISILCNGRRR